MQFPGPITSTVLGNIANAGPAPPVSLYGDAAIPGTFWWDTAWKQLWVLDTSGSWTIAVNPPGMATMDWVDVQIDNAILPLQSSLITLQAQISDLQNDLQTETGHLQTQIDALEQRIDELPPYIIVGTEPALSERHPGLFWWNNASNDLNLWVIDPPRWVIVGGGMAPTTAIWDGVPGPPSVWDGGATEWIG
jgi:hypothetical protein